MYLGFNYDLARGMQDEILRWAAEQRRVKRVRAQRPDELLPRSEQGPAQSTGEEEVSSRRAS